MVKTRLQLASSSKQPTSNTSALKLPPPAQFTSSYDCVRFIVRTEGIRGLYSGLTASYLGVTEGVIHWVLYERLKRLTGGDGKSWTTEGEKTSFFQQWLGMMGSAGTAKTVASLITYPHEVNLSALRFRGLFAHLVSWGTCMNVLLSRQLLVHQVIRTRLRQPMSPETGKVKYTGLWQTLKVVIAEEGVRSLYGGLSAHLLRVVPNAAIMYTIYEGVLRWEGP